MITKQINHIQFTLKEDHDFSWMNEIGKVFKVFDQQDSGNISFGIEINGRKLFLKYAGAKTINTTVEPEIAINNLKRSVSIYRDLNYKHLINLRESIELERGYALLFDWFDGETLHNHWDFPPPYKYEHPKSPYFRFRQLPIRERIYAFNNIVEFHVHVEKNGYVAIDFYDGSILYNFSEHEMKICDIDLYQKKPYRNQMGRMWGSSRFMSPEEFEFGAVIDEKTNVFNMGAIAFGLLGGELDRTIEKWEASKELYEVAIKAVQKDRNKRFSNVEEFYQAWKSQRD